MIHVGSASVCGLELEDRHAPTFCPLLDVPFMIFGSGTTRLRFSTSFKNSCDSLPFARAGLGGSRTAVTVFHWQEPVLGPEPISNPRPKQYGGFQKLRALSTRPVHEDHSPLRSILGSPIVGNSHMSCSEERRNGCIPNQKLSQLIN